MNKNLTLLIVFLLGSTTLLTAQEFSYGFRTGLNFNRFLADSELDANGAELEEFTGAGGFHLAASFYIKFTDLVGLRPELVYSQRGGRVKYEGPSYLVYFDEGERRIINGGMRTQNVNVTNSYIDLPVVFYYRPVQTLEIFGGAYVGATINSTGSGRLVYTAPGNEAVEAPLDLNFFRDQPEDTFTEGGTPVQVNGNGFLIPRTFSAYYDRRERDGTFYNTLDYGLIGGLSIYMNEALFLSGRLQYGMADVTRGRYDVSLQSLDGNNEFIETDDIDRYLTIQVSVGFGF